MTKRSMAILGTAALLWAIVLVAEVISLTSGLQVVFVACDGRVFVDRRVVLVDGSAHLMALSGSATRLAPQIPAGPTRHDWSVRGPKYIDWYGPSGTATCGVSLVRGTGTDGTRIIDLGISMWYATTAMSFALALAVWLACLKPRAGKSATSKEMSGIEAEGTKRKGP
jgi:hypothetical protein